MIFQSLQKIKRIKGKTAKSPWFTSISFPSEALSLLTRLKIKSSTTALPNLQSENWLYSSSDMFFKILVKYQQKRNNMKQF